MSFDKILEDIDRQLEEDRATLGELEQQVAGMRERVQRLVAAKRAMSLPRKPAKGQAKPRKVDKGHSDWKPGPESIQAILTVLSEAPAALTIKQIEMATGRSHSHIDSSVRYLRDHELVRLAGRKGMANLYAPMTNTGLKETDSAAYAA